jgi:hypothetical protein
MKTIPRPVPASPKPYYALAGPWQVGCVDWNYAGSQKKDLAYVTMASWRSGEDLPLSLVTTILDARDMIPASETLESRHLLAFACLKLPVDAFRTDEDRINATQALLEMGEAETHPWHSLSIAVDGTPVRFLAYRHDANHVVMASREVEMPITVSVFGNYLQSYELIDSRPSGS